MNKEKIDFETSLESKLKALNELTEIVLSTSKNDNVTSRVVSCAFDNTTIYFLSWEHHTKCNQIKANSKVSLCHANIQIKGIAEIIGSPLLEKNTKISEKIKARLPQLFNEFSKYDGMTIVKVEIEKLKVFCMNQAEYYFEYIDVIK